MSIEELQKRREELQAEMDKARNEMARLARVAQNIAGAIALCDELLGKMRPAQAGQAG